MSQPQTKQILNHEEAPLALPAHYRVTCATCNGDPVDIDGDGDAWTCSECKGAGVMTFSVCEINGALYGWLYEQNLLVSFANHDDARIGAILDRWTYRGLQHNGLRDARVLDVLQIPRWTDDCGIERMVEQRPWDGLAKAVRG